MLTALRDFFWIQQDYLWFLAGLGWLAVGLVWWPCRRSHELPGWIPWSVGAGVATAISHIAILVTPILDLYPYQAPSLRGDMVLGFITAAQAFGWWWAGLHGRAHRRKLSAGIGLLVAALASIRVTHPIAGTIGLAVVSLGACHWWIFRSNHRAIWWPAILAVFLGTSLDPGGPVFSLFDNSLRWWEVTDYGPWAALAQIAVTATILGTFRRSRLTLTRAAVAPSGDRWPILTTALWLATGLGLAIGVGAWSRSQFEHSAVTRTRAATAMLSVPDLENLLNDKFVVDERTLRPFRNNDSRQYAESEHARNLRPPVDAAARRIVELNRDVRVVSVTSIRDGWLFYAAGYQRHQPEPPRIDRGHVTVLRRVTERDLAAWENPLPSFSYAKDPSSANVIARAPLQDSAGRMLGWLGLHFSSNQWLAAQAQPRALAYLIVALGLVIGQQRVTQKQRARERDRAEARAAAIAQTNELKTTFLAKVSHELRTPLQSFLGYTELMLPEANARDRARLLAMREHAALMRRLVNDLIDLSAAECGKFQLVTRPVNLAELVTQAAESLRPAAEAKGLAFAISVAPDVPASLLADPQRVRQVVLNLVGNAIKFTERGRVAVALAVTAVDAQAACVEFRVTDTGPGIAPEAQRDLFAAFTRLAPTAQREGTGLGLAIVAAVSRAMGGDVNVTSDGRSGSTFTARWLLPVAAPTTNGESPRVPLHGKRVLVADDNALVRELFIAYLTECGAVCAAAVDGIEALELLRRERFDAVVLDLAMPRLDGLATVRQLRRDAPQNKWRIVGVSAHAGGAEHRDALTAGMDAFLTKPVALPELARALAPATDWLPPDSAFAPVRAHFAHRFRADAPLQGAAVAAALGERTWPELARAAHHLRNSAGVVGDAELTRACAALETAARASDEAGALVAWQHVQPALARWQADPSSD